MERKPLEPGSPAGLREAHSLQSKERPRSAEFLEEAAGDHIGPDLPEPGLTPSKGGYAEWQGQHAINLRLSVPLPFFPFYLTIVAGREKRGKKRRQQDRKKHPLLTFGNMLLMGYSGMTIAIALGTMATLATIFVIQRLFEIEIILK